jgi:hypothetical protein
MGDRRLTALAAIFSAAVAILAAPRSLAAPATCHAASGPQTVPLVELFTSEGCDSCPPADRWLSARFPAETPAPSSGAAAALPAGASGYALAFHVDYWDRLGWRDRFASARFTQRQYEEMTASGASFVYTPQILVQGHDVPNWNRGQAGDAIAAAARHAPRATVRLDVTPEANALRINAGAAVDDPAQRKRAALWVAYTDSGHVTDVGAGENRGVRLRHDHVVRSLHGPYPIDAKGTAAASLVLAPPSDAGYAPVIVAFVQDAGTGDVLQAVASSDCAGR